ncbi:ABC transporter permease [Deinococcus sp. KSM4-11]|uniref:ABC transporter permease n=1 Tax=Deinococcus sp. KSM4-11 TaxID=2568654 RepID=UPI0010A3D1A6|nr:ABC transporter permease [Deinococcus sp. KSM4-11]THF88165.1 ABC transporter permease [Deinococcus sp. KSM4-11]
MIPFLVRRLVQAIPTLLLSSLLIFFVISLAPGDFLTPARLNPNISQARLDALTHNFGLDKPLVEQYFLWLKNILHGEFGLSFSYQAPVWNIMIPRIANSLWLVLLITVVFYGIAIPVGVFGAVRQNSLGDRSVNVFMYFLLGFPSFFLALIALYALLQIIFATHWAIPIGGMTSADHDTLSPGGKIWDVFRHLLVPGILLGIHSTAGLSRYVRALMLEVMNSDYIRTARAKGVSESSAIWKHTFRNAILPIVAGIGGELPGLISGAGFIEVVFAYPGITPMLLDALNAQDLYLIAGFTMMTTILLIIGNAISDMLLAFVDPRVKLG